MEKANTKRMGKGIVTTLPFDSKEILTPEEAGMLFGVSSWAMYKRAKRGQMPSHKIGARVYFSRKELLTYTLQR
jgi:excisionase family DNA binding protein